MRDLYPRPFLRRGAWQRGVVLGGCALLLGAGFVACTEVDPGNSSDPCAGVDCSGRGSCSADFGRAFCRCDEGYEAFGLACVPPGETSVSYGLDRSGVNGFDVVDAITWLDAKGRRREAYFARSYPSSIFPQIAGYMTRFVWRPDEAPIVASEDLSGIDAPNAQGWGINVMHIDGSQAGGFNPWTRSLHPATTTKRDGFDFLQGPVFWGPHHLIFRTAYKQYTTLVRGTPEDPGIDDRKAVDVTVDWVFFSGLDHFVYAITIDATREFRADGDPFRNDTRAPYCLFSSQSWIDVWDWSGVGGAPSGQGWGDAKKFVTSDMQNWSYGAPNTIPYVWEWVNEGGDAEAGFIQTETYAQKQAGSGFNGGRDASGAVLPGLGGEVRGYSFQMNYYSGYTDKRLTWGLPYGAIDGGYGSSVGYQNYSVAMHIGKHSDQGVPRLIAETERIHDGRLTVEAITGELLREGPEGCANPTPHTYSPPGYNAVYRTWEVRTVTDAVELRFRLVEGTYDSPVFVVWNIGRDGLEKISVRHDGVELVDRSDYLWSFDGANDRLFVTLLGTLAGDHRLEIRRVE